MSDNDSEYETSKTEASELVFTLSDIKSALVSQLREWAKFYNIENYVKISKPELKKQLRQYANDYNDDEVVKPDWQIEADYKAELERIKSVREFELRERERENAERIESEKREHEFKLEREKREHEFKLEREKRESEREQRELELKKLESKNISETAFKIENAVKFVNKFHEQDVELFFKTFEQLAVNNKWPKANWPTLVHAQFVGKAAKAISLLSNVKVNDYDTVKNCVLKAYERVPQYYNEKFRNFVKLVNDSYTDFYQNLSMWYERWLKSLNITNFDDLREMILLEQYLNCVPIDVKTYLLERNVKNAREAAKISDEYSYS